MDRFDSIAGHLKVLADGFYLIVDGKKVLAERKKVNRRRFRVCVVRFGHRREGFEGTRRRFR